MPDAAHKWTDAEIARIENDLRYHYQEAMAQMMDKQAKFEQVYNREVGRWADKYRTMKITEAEYQRQISEYVMKREWYDNMIESLAEDAINANERATELINDRIPGVYSENYNYATYQVENGLRINTNFTMMDQDTVRNIIKNDPDLVPTYKTNRARDYEWNKQKFNSAVLQGLIQGESIEDMAGRLESVMGMNYRAACRNARTAATCAQNAGRLQSFMRMRANGINVRKQWIATLDRRTRDSHRREDNSVAELEAHFPNTGLLYPGDASTNDLGEIMNCRCTMVADFDAIDTSEADRFERLDYGQTYDEWKEGHGG